MEGNLPKVTCICATCGRHNLMERSMRFFLNQDYEGIVQLLIFNNSVVPQRIGFKDGDKDIIIVIDFKNGAIAYFCNQKETKLVNQSKDSITEKPYKSLGAIYNDELKYIDEDTDILVHWDDDDIFLPNHISEGVKGLQKAESLGKIAYKPRKSYYRHPNGVELMENVLEPSIFVKAQHIKTWGYSDETTAQHLQWVHPLIESNMILSDEEGKPTLIYNWGDHIPTFKTSGDPHNKSNFSNYRNFSQDHGDQILTPWSKKEVEEYYKTS